MGLKHEVVCASGRIRTPFHKRWNFFLVLRLKKGGFTIQIHCAITFNSCVEHDV